MALTLKPGTVSQSLLVSFIPGRVREQLQYGIRTLRCLVSTFSLSLNSMIDK
ncbi:hypothetical protein [Salipaludibacillus agaradhaerens]|uniref:hypothetical protein n=1 Tax=Salipaludibacillus agaradhaerens TaxID=76935 RepID=UPI002151663E|nr:hypothetical protein [Salipaludibacillus agaradhaerens]